MRYFNTEGPVEPEEHYCIPPLDRVDLDEILTLVRRKKYFVIHAPRQTGKTSTLEALADWLAKEGTYHSLYINVEAGQAFRESVSDVMRIILGEIVSRARTRLKDQSLIALRREVLHEEHPGLAFYEFLSRWSAASPKPLVLLIDEIDSLIGDSLISTLRQLRAGYNRRPTEFSQSVVLCGQRDVRDYRIYSSSQGGFVSGGSVFNVKAESMRLGDFSEREVRALLAQHTAATGQSFGAGAARRVMELTSGQPWLVNALAYQACFKDEVGGDRSRPIHVSLIDRAKDTLILKRVMHLDQLADKLREDRVRRVIMPMLAGSGDWDYSIRDLEYLRDLGLVAPEGAVRIANQIYAEVVPRELTASLQSGLAGKVDPEWYVKDDGSLDVVGLLSACQAYFREYAESWVERFGHREAGPQLVLHAYLQRVVNSFGRMAREYAVGRGRADLLIEWRRGDGRGSAQTSKHVIECKVRRERPGSAPLIREGLEQTAAYMDKCGAESGHLVIFDMRQGKTWEERMFRRDLQKGDHPITVWGM